MSLKHKNTSKWSKAQNRYAKYSDRAREQVQEQLEISKQLTKKLKPMQKDQDSDEEPNNNVKNANQTDKDINLGELLTNSNGLLENNPWMRMMGDVGLIKSTNDLNKDDSLLSQDYSRPKAFTDKRELQKAQDELNGEDEEFTDDEFTYESKHGDLIKIFAKNQEDKEEEDKDGEDKEEEKEQKEENLDEKEEKQNIKIRFPSKGKTKIKESTQEQRDAKVSLFIENDTTANNEIKSNNELKKIEKNITPIESSNLKDVNLSIKKNNSEKHQITLSEAFADDDVIEEFKAEKVILHFYLY